MALRLTQAWGGGELARLGALASATAVAPGPFSPSATGARANLGEVEQPQNLISHVPRTGRQHRDATSPDDVCRPRGVGDLGRASQGRQIPQKQRVFSSRLNTTARFGGYRFSPTTLRSFVPADSGQHPAPDSSVARTDRYGFGMSVS